MSLADDLRRARRMPLGEALARGFGKARRELRLWSEQRRDARRPTHSPAPEGELLRYLAPLPPDALRAREEDVLELAGHFLAHRFDLLGSGWVRVRHGMRCPGVEGHRYHSGPEVRADRGGRWLEGRINPSNLAESRRVWALVDEGYEPVDWHLDFRSGFRWSEGTWWRDVPFQHGPGIDVKVPWELARMQHLPVLACAHALTGDGAYPREFRNQVLDFVAANPPRYGVNWRLAMDVAIRAAGWLAGYDLFRAHGAVFDAEFERVLLRSVYDHGRYVVRHLEWNPEVRGNHYLANVAGLLFVAAYLPRTPETDAWLAFAARELASETALQFTPDGASFESSTSYHRLSAEMVAYATALLLALPEEKRRALAEYDARRWTGAAPLAPAPVPPLPPEHFARLERMADFTVHVTKPGGRVVQVGDNDSGRFLKLLPVHRRTTVAEAKALYASLDGYDALPDDASYLDEDALDHRDTVAVLNGLLDREDLAAFTGDRRRDSPGPLAVSCSPPPSWGRGRGWGAPRRLARRRPPDPGDPRPRRRPPRGRAPARLPRLRAVRVPLGPALPRRALRAPGADRHRRPRARGRAVGGAEHRRRGRPGRPRYVPVHRAPGAPRRVPLRARALRPAGAGVRRGGQARAGIVRAA